MNRSQHVCPACGYCQQGRLALSGPPKRGNIKESIRRLLKACGPQGLTVEDLTKLTHVGHQSVSARVHELERAGELRCVDARATSSGTPARAFVLREPPEGLER